jgi:hypothetical protein
MQLIEHDIESYATAVKTAILLMDVEMMRALKKSKGRRIVIIECVFDQIMYYNGVRCDNDVIIYSNEAKTYFEKLIQQR